MNIKAKIDRLEEKNRADGQTCPHLPPRVVRPPEEPHTAAPDLRECECGRERLTIIVEYVDSCRADGAPL